MLIDSGARFRFLSLTISKRLLLAVAMIGILLLGGGGTSIALWVKENVAVRRLNRAEAKQEQILDRYVVLEDEMGSLEIVMAYFEQVDSRLREYGSMEILPPDVREMGVGGPAVEDSDILGLKQVNSPLYPRVSEVSQRMDYLTRKAGYLGGSFVEIERKLDKDQYVRDHTPSVIPTKGCLVSGFGYRIDPFLFVPRMHTGVDISNQPGTPVKASADGVVSFVGEIEGYGLAIKIDHDYEIETLYGHLSGFYVEEGDTVYRDQVIGAMGNTGRSKGPHLHYEVRVGGSPVNPKKYFFENEYPPNM